MKTTEKKKIKYGIYHVEADHVCLFTADTKKEAEAMINRLPNSAYYKIKLSINHE